MKITMLILASLLASPITTAPTESALPNLCDDVYLGADGAPLHDSSGVTLARYCQWTGPDAPVLASEICCELDATGAACLLPDDRGRCSSGERYWCDFGEANSFGGVICYQPLPDACEAGYCVAPPAVPPVGEPFESMCCFPGGCFPIEFGDDCEGEYVACSWGMSNADGTVECFD